jgi:hypothetical protein
MKLNIISTTDGQFSGMDFEDVFPLVLGESEFTPDGPPIDLGDKKWRYYNSNYSIDAQEI